MMIGLIFGRQSLLRIHASLSPPTSLLRESGMSTIEMGDPDRFEVPSTIPQDLLLIHSLVGGDLPQVSSGSQNRTAETNDTSVMGTANHEEDDADSIASSSGEDSLDEEGDVDMLKAAALLNEKANKGADSEEEVEAGLLDGGEGGDPMTM